MKQVGASYDLENSCLRYGDAEMKGSVGDRLAVLLGGVLCLAVLAWALVGMHSMNVVAATPAAAAGRALSVADVPVASVKHSPWDVSVDRDEMSDAKRVVFMNAAISGLHDEKLIVRCQGRKLSLYVVTDTIPGQDESYNSFVQVRFDGDRAQRQSWTRSDDGKALFDDNPRPLLLAMEKHDKMLFRFTPVDEVPETASFDLSGLEDEVAAHAECQALLHR